MSKANRIHGPGCIFHITARTQGHQPWFTEAIRQNVAAEIIASARMAGFLLFAFAVMPNHFHILVRQGAAPLAFMMHRVMHRSALMLRRAHQLQGHIFERRYYSGLCSSPSHVRAAIVYIHLNAWRAKLCSTASEYPFSSQPAYAAQPGSAPCNGSVAVSEGLRFFAKNAEDDGHSHYHECLNFQMAIDSLLGRDGRSWKPINAPDHCVGGDEYWLREYGNSADIAVRKNPRLPIFDVARKVLRHLDPTCPLDVIRSRNRNKRVVFIRNNLIAALHAQGYSGVAIARFVGVSTSSVSAITVSLRA